MTVSTTYPLNPQVAALQMPDRIRHLPVGPNGFPVPYFVAWVDGKPEFRAADRAKKVRAIREKLCWVCGGKLGTKLVFVLGPMCAANRISAEPPCHLECAEFSVRACPFLSRPDMDRREGHLPAGVRVDDGPGVMIRRNPGVTVLWCTKAYNLVPDRGDVLFSVGEPFALTAWAEGRAATVEEIRHSFDTGVPALEGIAAAQGPLAVAALVKVLAAGRRRLGIGG